MTEFLQEELPIRLAHRVKELDELPENLSQMPSIIKVKEWYAQSFEVSLCLRSSLPCRKKRRERGIEEGARPLNLLHPSDSPTRPDLFLPPLFPLCFTGTRLRPTSRSNVRNSRSPPWEIWNVRRAPSLIPSTLPFSSLTISPSSHLAAPGLNQQKTLPSTLTTTVQVSKS